MLFCSPRRKWGRAELKQITFFHLPYCPYCLDARRIMADLYREYPEFKNIPVQEIDESRERALAESYDYYLVPAYYIGEEKLHEGIPTKKSLLKVFQFALA
jgi:thioredoxin 1